VAWEAFDLLVNPNTEPEDCHQPYVVALTGGIASGKTMISDEFARLGVPVIDTDVIAHEIVEPGRPALQDIVDSFGPTIIDAHGQLKRSDLRALIFSNPSAREKLESILHPQIRKEMSDSIKKIRADYCILVIPLLADRDSYPSVNRILVVDVEPEKQIRRLMLRDNCNPEQARQALAAQISRGERLQIADDVLNNSGSPQQARNGVKQLHEKYTKLAANR
jgi:dephospho-CoA kinase